jgi:hypothetical protein
LKNDDLCSELLLSKEGMRFDQKLKDKELQEKKKSEEN